MPHEFLLHHPYGSELNKEDAYKHTLFVNRLIEEQLKASGKHPLNLELLRRMRGIEEAKNEARSRKGIIENYCIRMMNKDKSPKYRIGFTTILSNGRRVETLLISASEQEPVIKYEYSFVGNRTNRQIIYESKNNVRTIARARRMLKLPIL